MCDICYKDGYDIGFGNALYEVDRFLLQPGATIEAVLLKVAALAEANE